MNTIKNRVNKGIKNGFWNANTLLKDFVLITYLVDVDRLRQHIPKQFEIVTIQVNGQKKGIMSAVPFLDKDFHIKRFFPFIKFNFYQTNYRVYIKDIETGEHLVWFFGTNLGSIIVNLPRLLWKIPWHFARYKNLSTINNYHVNIKSKFNSGTIQFKKLNQAIKVLDGFKDMDEMLLILTHPVKGVYYKLNGKIGTYRISHEKMKLKLGKAVKNYFSLYNSLNLLTESEMNQPYAIFYTDEIEFDIELPPKNN